MEEVKCYMPQTLAEALQIRKETGAQPLAGGSDLMVANSRGAGIVPGFKKPILIISNLPELKGIRRLDDGTVEIGALSTSWEIHTSPVTHPLLKDAASRMGAIALRNSATIGGNISTNAGGMRAVKYGVTRDYVRGLELVLADGRVVTAGTKNVKDASGLSLKHIVIGSEGTLAVITKCILKLVPKPEKSLSVVVPFPDLSTGISGVLSIIRANANPTAIEFTERTVVELGEKFTGLKFPVPEAGAYIILTFDGTGNSVTDSAARVREVALKAGALDYITLDDPEAAANIWKVRGCLVKAVEAVSEQEPVDLVVPINRTADFIKFVHETEKKSGMQMVAFGHAGDGNVHLCMVRGKRSDAEWEHDLHKNMTTVYNYAYSLGGLTSGEHGIGVAKRPYFLGATAPENLDLMRSIKTAFDPKHILNDHISYLK